MSVDVYIACEDCRRYRHSRINARHEAALAFFETPGGVGFAASVLEVLESYPDFGPDHECTQIVREFGAEHEGHRTGVKGADDICVGGWQEASPPG